MKLARDPRVAILGELKMVELRYLRGAVYIFENSEAQRVKVGMTSIGVNDFVERLRDVNDMWLQRKITCQICGKHTALDPLFKTTG